MTSKTTRSNFTFAALVALSFMVPVSAQAQALVVTCEGGTGSDTCVQSDAEEIVAAVNQNATDIDANTIAAGNAQTAADNAQVSANNAQTTADQAVSDAAAAQTAADNAQDAADAAQATADGAVAVNNTQQTEIDANAAGVAANLATNNAQQTEIDANAAGVATNAAGVAANLATNNTQQIEIDANTAGVAANAAGIAANAADIVDLQDGLADLRTDLNQGLAMANAMEVFAPDPGSNFRLNIGTGFHDSEAAIGITASGRVGTMGDTIVYLGVAASEDVTAGKAGVSFQW